MTLELLQARIELLESIKLITIVDWMANHNVQPRPHHDGYSWGAYSATGGNSTADIPLVIWRNLKCENAGSGWKTYPQWAKH